MNAESSFILTAIGARVESGPFFEMGIRNLNHGSSQHIRMDNGGGSAKVER